MHPATGGGHSAVKQPEKAAALKKSVSPDGTPHRRHRSGTGISSSRPPVLPDIRGLLESAFQHACTAQFDRAFTQLDLILNVDATCSEALRLKGSLLVNDARFDEAEVICAGIIKREPFCTEAYLMLGFIAMQRGKHADALERFREVVYLDASCWSAHFYSAEIHTVQRDEKRSHNGYRTALRLLEQGPRTEENGRVFFPLMFNTKQFITVCRHKLLQLNQKNTAETE